MYSNFCRSLPRGNNRLAATRGFTLIEAMAVVGALAIVITLTYPICIDQIHKAWRTDAGATT